MRRFEKVSFSDFDWARSVSLSLDGFAANGGFGTTSPSTTANGKPGPRWKMALCDLPSDDWNAKESS